ncbi:MAG: GNVR domain-containing protein [Terriglobales bacterium]
MSRRPITNPLEYLQAARRRWIWILAPAVLIAAATMAAARKLPKLYTSESLILVEQQKVPADFVKPTVSNNVASRLESLEEQILSRTQLSTIIQKFGLYAGRGLNEDQQVTQMASDITVTPIFVGQGDRITDQVSAIKVAYQGPDPLLAQQVTRELSQLFITENLKSRSEQAMGTEGFIDNQLAQASQQLTTLEAQLTQVKNTYMGSLPEQQGANLQVMGQLQAELQADTEALAQLQSQKTYLNSLSDAVAKLGPAALGPAPPSATEQQLRKAQSDLAIAEQMYTPKHPAVISLRAQVRALQGQVAAEKAEKPASEAPAATATGTATAAATAPTGAKSASKPGTAGKDAKDAKADPDNSALAVQQKSQIALLDQEIQHRLADQATTQGKISALQARIDALPAVEEKLANLQNSYDVAKTSYTTLLQQKQAAAMGAAMEQQAEGEEFRIVDPANLPLAPSSPNLVRINMLGGLGGLVVGVGLGFLMEMRDSVVRNEADIAYHTHTPMLAALPMLPSAGTLAATRSRLGLEAGQGR